MIFCPAESLMGNVCMYVYACLNIFSEKKHSRILNCKEEKTGVQNKLKQITKFKPQTYIFNLNGDALENSPSFFVENLS